jgi:hypothetical protein
MSTHIALRPSWRCAACGDPWPCPTRREQLLAEYGNSRVSLSLYLSSCLVEATQDLPHHQAGAHYQRFIGWLREPPAQPDPDAPGRAPRPAPGR